MANLTDVFERIVCINLDRRTDRWQLFTDRLRRPGIESKRIARFAAIDGEMLPPPLWWRAGRGAWGCHQSHVRILEDAMQDQVQSVLIFEDDAVFAADFLSQFDIVSREVPPDWEGIMLGGRHVQKPVAITKHVVRVQNARRTHAHALRGRYLEAAYEHLCDYPGHAQFPGQHVDHRLAHLHKTDQYAVYAPSTWLVGQAADFSNIRDRAVPQRFWNGADSRAKGKASCKPTPPVAVLGLYRSGSSCVAGILMSLGFHLGSQMLLPDEHNKGGYLEPRWLSRRLRALWDEPALAAPAPRAQRVQLLRSWLKGQCRAARAAGAQIALKHPLLCLMGDEIVEAWGDDTKFIAVHRPFKESLDSLERADWWEPELRRPILTKLWKAREKFLATHDHLVIKYHALLRSPAQEIRRIVRYLNIHPTAAQFADSINSVHQRA